MTTISGDPMPHVGARDRFMDPRLVSRDPGRMTTRRGGFTEADHLVALASSGRSIRLFTAPGGLDDFGRDERKDDRPTSH